MSASAAAQGRASADHHGVGAVARALSSVRQRIAQAAERAGRSPSSVTLVAVSKGFGPEAVAAAHSHGHADFGESRAQELRAKAGAASESGLGLRWHFVGRLQRNKVTDVVGLASLIHSVDRLPLAEAIDEQARRSGRVQRVLLQVNANEDPAKAGCSIEAAPEMLDAIRGLEWLACEGLMTIPALDADPRPAFAAMRTLRDRVREHFPEVQHLSMGMSRDFESAVEEGATLVRVGEGVFGPRPPRES